MAPGDTVKIKPHLAKQVHPRADPDREGIIHRINTHGKIEVLWPGTTTPVLYHPSLLTVVSSNG